MAVFRFQPFLNFNPFLCLTFHRKTFFKLSLSLNCYCCSSSLKHDLQNSLLKVKDKNKSVFLKTRSLTLSSQLLRKIYTKDQNKKGKKNVPEPFTDVEEEDLEDVELNTLLYKSSLSLWDISSVAVLQPWVKWGPDKRQETTPDILLDEACSLVRSLPFVEVSYKEYISLQCISKSHVFGTGNLIRLKNDIRKSGSQAVFISLNHLSRAQKSELEEYFGMKVFDRFFIVLAIFKHHASTLEARLQVAMAEMPMMSKHHLYEKDRLLLDRKQAKLNTALKRLEMKRETFRKARQKASIPTVAVVGYTNCGKTTLIRAITGDKRAQGEDRLFATLDATAHKGVLPCGLCAIFMDSVGFIQDIPASLIASFRATFQDTIYSDVVVVVRDVSHPDIVGQMNAVQKTLRSLPLAKETPVVVVNNKADLLDEDAQVDDTILQEGIMTSAITGEGLNELLVNIELEVLRVTGRKMYLLRLLTGSSKIEWLKDNAGVSSEQVDEKDPQFTIVRVFLSELEKAAFRKVFQL